MMTPLIERIEIDMTDLEKILERARTGPLSEDDRQKLKAALETLLFLTNKIEDKNITIKRLRQLLFGHKTEKQENVLPEKKAGEEPHTSSAAGDAENESGVKESKKRKGHGRNGAGAYWGAKKVPVSHESIRPGDSCVEEWCAGTLYRQRKPRRLVRVKGRPPLDATVYDLEEFRCNLCGKVYTAKVPEGIGEEKYDETAAAMIAILKYGSGVPFYRIKKLQESLGIPLPTSTQWDIVHEKAQEIGSAYCELIRQAAQGEVLHNDDTTARILELMGKRRERSTPSGDSAQRTGIFTSGIVSVTGGRKIALFFTGREHAGENLAKVLEERRAELEPPIQMCDGLSRNIPGKHKTVLSNCNSHSRRQFVDLADTFPEETRYVIETIGEVFKNDAEARRRGMSPQERLAYHREHSRRPMVELRMWFRKQFRERRVEPNSVLGGAIDYMRKRWRKLTLFYRRAGAPIDNNLAERVLKKAILHRKNSMFFLSLNGARVGDIFMSLIHTAELSGADPFDYLTELQKNSTRLSENPAAWMPWNYRETLSTLAGGD